MVGHATAAQGGLVSNAKQRYGGLFAHHPAGGCCAAACTGSATRRWPATLPAKPTSNPCATSLCPHAVVQVNTQSTDSVRSVANVTDIHETLDFAGRQGDHLMRPAPAACGAKTCGASIWLTRACGLNARCSPNQARPLFPSRLAPALLRRPRWHHCRWRASGTIQVAASDAVGSVPLLVLMPACPTGCPFHRGALAAPGHLEHPVDARQPGDCGWHQRPGAARLRHDAGGSLGPCRRFGCRVVRTEGTSSPGLRVFHMMRARGVGLLRGGGCAGGWERT